MILVRVATLILVTVVASIWIGFLVGIAVWAARWIVG
jgi:hypothetical protein